MKVRPSQGEREGEKQRSLTNRSVSNNWSLERTEVGGAKFVNDTGSLRADVIIKHEHWT